MAYPVRHTLRQKVNKRFRLIVNPDVNPESSVNDNWGLTASRPDNWELAKTWDSGGTYDLDLITAGASTPVFNGFDISADGTKVIVTNHSDDEGHSYLLSTAWDFSTASVLTESPLGLTNSSCAQWLNEDGDTLLYSVLFTTTDVNYILEMAVDYVLEGGNDGSATTGNYGFDDSLTGPTRWVKDGTSMYWVGEMQTNDSQMRKGTVAVPYYLDGVPVALTSVSIDSTIGTVSTTNDSFVISTDEKYVLYSKGGTVALGTMSTPGDITTLVFDMVNTKALGLTGPIHVNEAFTKCWQASSSTLTVEIKEWDIPIA